MQIKFLLIASAALVFTSCSTAYKSGQTPDDVYYSPARVVEEDNNIEEDKTETYVSNDEREIRMKARDRRWRDMDYEYEHNCSCHYHPYKYGYDYGYYYNPYYYPYPVYTNVRYSNPKNSPARIANLGSYTPVTTRSVNPKTGRTEYIRKDREYNNSNNSTRSVRRILTGDNSSDNNRTYSPSRSSSNSSSGNGTPVARPKRGG